MTWTATIVNLRTGPKRKANQYRAPKKRKGTPREGYRTAGGLIAIPPKRGHKLSAWKLKMGISP